MNSTHLIGQLSDMTRQHLSRAEKLNSLSFDVLNKKPAPDVWSILECIEHLNRYGDFYIPEIRKRLAAAKYPPATEFKPGLLGNYFAKSMLPKEKLNRMKTFKEMNPNGSALGPQVLDRFIAQQKELLELLHSAGRTDLNKVKTSISISKWIKLKLGDTLRVVIYHNQRHMVQAEKLIPANKPAMA